MVVNLGMIDADRLKLNFADCIEGAEVTVSDDAGAWLQSRGFAKVLGESPQKAVPEASAKPVPAKTMKASKGKTSA